MNKSVNIISQGWSADQLAILFIAEQLRQYPTILDRVQKEVAPYKQIGAKPVTVTGVKVLFKLAAVSTVAEIKQKVFGKGLQIGLFKKTLSRSYAASVVAESEAIAQFLLSHNHAPQRIAECVFPPDREKPNQDAIEAEKSVIKIMDFALINAEKQRMTATARLLAARKLSAQQRIAHLS